MQIFLKNESDEIVIINLSGQNFSLLPHEGKYAEITNGEVSMKLSTNESYSSEPITQKAGLSYFHRFITEAQYSFYVNENITLRFYCETAYGNNFESYQRVIPICETVDFSEPSYTVKAETEIKQKIEKTEKREVIILQGAGVAGKLISLKNKFDDMVAVSICTVIAIIIFALIWIFKDFKTAATVYLIIAAVGFFIWKLFIERAINKAKNKAKLKAENTFQKIFLPCTDMPGDLFRSKDSYFDTEYISAVFKYSTKRK